jgi:multiple sugar transport system substrate-binding protein
MLRSHGGTWSVSRSPATALTLLLAALLMLSVGCAGDQGSSDTGPVVLRVAVWKANNPAAWDQALQRFHALHPRIRVELDIGPNSSTQLHDLITQKLRNHDPSLDAFLMDVIWPPEFAAAGWALELDAWLTPEQREEFFPGTIEAVTYGGRIYGLPFNTDSGLLYYRRDLLAKYGLAPPETWPELVAQARRILRDEGDARLQGYSGQMRQYEGLVCNLLEFVAANGGDLLEPAAPPAVEAVAFVRDSIVHGIAPLGVLTYEEQESLDLFRDGGAIFLRNWPYAWAILQDSTQSRVAGRVGIARLPAFPGGRPAAALGGWSFGIHRESRHAAEAAAFIAFMTGPEMQAHFAVEAGKAPARRALYRDPGVLAANPHFADLLPVFETATPRPRTPIYPRISHILQRYLHQAIADPRSPLERLAQDAQAQIERELATLREVG